VGGFVKSVADGTKAIITSRSGLILQSDTQLSVAKAGLTTGDINDIGVAMGLNPDIVVIVGHNKDVEPAVAQIGAHENTPKAVLAVNGFTQLTNYGSDVVYAECVMMPTQWDSSSSTKDPVIGWTSAAFSSAAQQANQLALPLASLAMGGAPTYQQASAGAMGVALANAMNISSSKASLRATLAAMNVTSFYGRLQWDSMGRIQKPMYTVQKNGTLHRLVAPTGTMFYPLSLDTCWGQLEKFGFRVNSKVSWKMDDPSIIPRGTVGTVTGFTDEYVKVLWDGKDKDFLMDPENLSQEADDAVSGASMMAGFSAALLPLFWTWMCVQF
jgi:hypothetical protein